MSSKSRAIPVDQCTKKCSSEGVPVLVEVIKTSDLEDSSNSSSKTKWSTSHRTVRRAKYTTNHVPSGFSKSHGKTMSLESQIHNQQSKIMKASRMSEPRT